jgi:hypothetical protein
VTRYEVISGQCHLVNYCRAISRNRIGIDTRAVSNIDTRADRQTSANLSMVANTAFAGQRLNSPMMHFATGIAPGPKIVSPPKQASAETIAFGAKNNSLIS